MYTSYFYSASSTAANILSDVVAILTGETNVNNLSANCDKVNTVINASVRVAGWTLHDNAAGTNAKCLKAPVADNANQFKYLVIDTNSAGYIMTKVYELWNETTHTGTNLASTSNSTGQAQRVNVTSGGRLDISASERHCIMYSFQSGVYGNTYFSPNGILERTRLSPWDTVENGFPPFLFMSAYNGSNMECRRLNNLGAEVTANSYVEPIIANCYGTTFRGITIPATTIVCDDTKVNFKHAMFEFGFIYAQHGHLGGYVSQLCDLWLTTNDFGSQFDTVMCGTDEYIIWVIGPTANSIRLAVRKG